MTANRRYCTRSTTKERAKQRASTTRSPRRPTLNRTCRRRYKPRQDNDTPLDSYFNTPEPPPLPQALGKYLEVYMTEEHGRGVRTTRAEIPQGTVLYRENAAIHGLPCFSNEGKDMLTKRMRHAVATQLNTTQIGKFLALTHCGESDTEESRFKRNCFEDQNVDSIRSAASKFRRKPEEIDCLLNLWLDISMINHSCRPNAVVLITDPEHAKAELIAVTDLPVKGTEITISYIDAEEDDCNEKLRGTRQELLENGWGFVCSCDACGQPSPIAVQQMKRARFSISDHEAVCTDRIRETPDHRLEYINQLGEKLGLLTSMPSATRREPVIEMFERFFSQYETQLQRERMVYRLYCAHQTALDMYRNHWLDTKNDDLTFARIIYHREQLTKYTRVCFGAREAHKSAQEYAGELRRCIRRPKRKLNNPNKEEIPEDTKRRRILSIKGISTCLAKQGEDGMETQQVLAHRLGVVRLTRASVKSQALDVVQPDKRTGRPCTRSQARVAVASRFKDSLMEVSDDEDAEEVKPKKSASCRRARH